MIPVVLAVGPVGLMGCSQSAEAETATAQLGELGGETGVVVETVGEGSALEKAGLLPGDVLLAWERLPNPPANPQAAKGELASPFDWQWLVEEQTPRGRVRLLAQRQGVEKLFEVALGEWKGDVRPMMAAEMLGDYARGKELIEAEDFEAGIDLWHTVAGTAEDQVADRHLRCWLLLRIGISWAQARQWEQAQRVYRSALEAAQDHLAKVVIWQAIGDAYKKVSKFEAARRAYGSAQEIQTTKLGRKPDFCQGPALSG